MNPAILQQHLPSAGALSTGCTALKNREKTPNGSLESWEIQGTITGDLIPAGILAPASPSVPPGCSLTCAGCGQQLCRSLSSQPQLSPKYQCLGGKNTINPTFCSPGSPKAAVSRSRAEGVPANLSGSLGVTVRARSRGRDQRWWFLVLLSHRSWVSLLGILP